MLKTILTIYLSILAVSTFGQSPGKVAANLQWWFKANAGTSTAVDGGQVDNWTNNGNFSVKTTYRNDLSSAGYPKYLASALNFNPALRFSSSSPSVFQTEPSSRTNMNPTAGSNTVVAVFRSALKKGSFNSVFYYTPNIISTETGVSKRDYAFGFVDGFVAVKCDTIDDWAFNSTKRYNTAIPQIAIATKNRQASNTSPAPVQLLINGISDQNVTKVGTSYLLNSSDYFFSTVYYGLSIGALTNQQRTSINTYTGFEGDLAEIIVYDRVLTSTELVLVNSYLAVKYGITLDQTSQYSYLRSDGLTIWDAAKFGTFNHNIIGIGKDLNSALVQTKSRSVNAGSILTLYNPSVLDDNDFLTCSDNSLEIALDTVDITKELRGRSGRIWQIQETGEVGTVSIDIDLNFFYLPIKPENLVLIINDGPVFKSGKTTIVPIRSVSGNVVTFDGVNFDNDTARYFTLGELRVAAEAIPLKKPIIYQLISPNNDGFNDQLFIENIELYPVNDLSVFNTEGNLVYRKTNYQNGAWDCSKIIDGNYYYVLNIEGEKLSGHLVVKR